MKNKHLNTQLVKGTILSVLLSFVFLISYAQDNEQMKTIFGGENINHGGYGAMNLYYSQIDNKDAILIGAEGGWIINHKLTLGIAGFGFINDIYFNDIDDNKKFYLTGGYGGLLLAPVIMPQRPVHVSFPIIIGAGGIAYTSNNHWSRDHDEWDIYDSDAFFIIEPGVNIELNLISFMRLSIGGKYRITSNINLINTGSHVLNGFSVGLSLKFGKF